jgi:hypothetical protein
MGERRIKPERARIERSERTSLPDRHASGMAERIRLATRVPVALPHEPQLAAPPENGTDVARLRKPHLRFKWAEAITDEAWLNYREAIKAMRSSGVPFLLGGGFALATYTGRWRDTKDIDFYIHPGDRDRVVQELTKHGFENYYSRRAYDPKWIYRSVRSDYIVDIIWAMANQRTRVDEHWFDGAPSASVRGEHLKVVPLEEFLWCKLYIMQRDHCDWTDIFNLLYAVGPRIDWEHLIWRLEDDVPLLKALLTVYDWLCPKRARELPPGLRERLGLPQPQSHVKPKRNRIRLLDTRDWFAALLPKNKPLAI